MYPTTARTLAVAFAAGTFAITAAAGVTACSSDDAAPRATSSSAVDTEDTSGGGEPSTTDASTTEASTNDATTTDVSVVDEIEGDPVVGGATPLPATDAAAVRDELLALAENAPFGTGWGPDTTIVTAWLEVFPGMGRSLFDDQPATDTSISSSSAFLMEDVTAPGDQAFAWAVLDSSGRCAGAVAVIPGNADGSVSDSGLPTVFAPVDDLASCTARAAIEALARG